CSCPHGSFSDGRGSFQGHRPGFLIDVKELLHLRWGVLAQGVLDLPVGPLVRICGLHVDHDGTMHRVLGQLYDGFAVLKDGAVVIGVQYINSDPCGRVGGGVGLRTKAQGQQQ
uniref:Uncharacterized protein n=1 Tax=Gadus morhua TaxID=8049 RepID=A0A8C5CKR4_GADMO